MDPISLAIISAISAGALNSSTEIAKQALLDFYMGLKTLIIRKFGEESELVKAVDKLEENPKSDGRKKIVEEEVVVVKAAQDAEVLHAAQALLDHLKTQPNGEQNIQMAIGSYNVQADRDGRATLNINSARKDKHAR